MTIGSLFSGIGGLELGLEAAGLGPVLWQVEIDPFCRRILARHWPQAERFADVRAIDPDTLPRVSVLCGGFPCQDVSAAGKRAGLAGARSGLWSEFYRIIVALAPRAVVVENVTSGERLWLPRVRHDLVQAGYLTEAWRLGAANVGAPHRRMRTFVLGVAHHDDPRNVLDKGQEKRRRAFDGVLEHAATSRRQERCFDRSHGEEEHLAPTGASAVPDAFSAGQGGRGSPESGEPARDTRPDLERRVGRGADGLSAGVELPRRWPTGRGQEQAPWEPPRTVARRSEPQNAARLRALGNAVVPQVAELVGRRLLELLAQPRP